MKKKITEYIHKETNKSVLQETSLPLYLTSGYVYNSAQEAEDVFNEKKDLFIFIYDFLFWHISINLEWILFQPKCH